MQGSSKPPPSGFDPARTIPDEHPASSGTVSRPPPSEDLRATVAREAPSDLSSTVAVSSPMNRTRALDAGLHGTQLLYGGDEVSPDSGAALISSGASTQPVQGQQLPPDAPEWQRMGRILALQIEDAIARNAGDPETRSAIGRAWAAWQLGGYRPSQIRRVAGLVEQAQRMMLSTSRQDRDGVIEDCARIISSGLPSDLREYLPKERVRAAVALLVTDGDPEAARVDAVSRLFGWSDSARAWAAEVIALAIGGG